MKFGFNKNVSTVTVASPLFHPFPPHPVILYVTSAESGPTTRGYERFN